MNRNLTLLLLVFAATGLIAAGCGDDDDDGGETGGDLTQQEWVAQADEICTEGNEELDAAAEETFGNATEPPSQEEQEAFAADEVIPSIEGQIDDVRDLGGFEGDDGQVDAFLEQADTELEAAKDDPSLFTDASSANPFEETNALAADLGLEVCSR